jgi:enoyl-CoA hydratase
VCPLADLEVRVADSVLWLTFNRPEVLNAVDGPMMASLASSLEDARARDDVRVVVITGTGAGFSAGADMASLRLAPEHPVETMDGANRVIRAVVSLDKPVLAAVNGIAAGVACSAALARRRPSPPPSGGRGRCGWRCSPSRSRPPRRWRAG